MSVIEARLRTLAAAATPGPWRQVGSERRSVEAATRHVAWCGLLPERFAIANAAYIAALSPDVGTALADVVAAARGCRMAQASGADIDAALARLDALGGGK